MPAMTPTQEDTRKTDIVEAVAKAIDGVVFSPGVNTYGQSQKAARAAIRATMEHLRDNVTPEMLAAAIPLADGDPPAFAKKLAAAALLTLSVSRNIPNEGDVVPHAAQIVVDFRAMLNAALSASLPETTSRGEA